MSQKMKVILIGDSGVGKTNLIIRFAKNQFQNQEIATIGGAQLQKSIIINNQQIILNIWDTAGQERYRSVVRQYFAGSQLCLIVFDLALGLQSRYWIDQAKQIPNCKLALVGNKCDLAHKVSGREVADECGIDYFEVSALSGEKVHDLFQQMCEQALQYVEEVPEVVLQKVSQNKTCCM